MNCHTCGILSVIPSSLAKIGQNSSVEAHYRIAKVPPRLGSISKIEGLENCVSNNKARHILQPACHGFKCLEIIRHSLSTHQIRSSQ